MHNLYINQSFCQILKKVNNPTEILLELPSVEVSTNRSDPFLPAPPPAADFGNQCISVGNTSSGSLTNVVVSFEFRFHFKTRWSSAPE